MITLTMITLKRPKLLFIPLVFKVKKVQNGAINYKIINKTIATIKINETATIKTKWNSQNKN